MPVFTNLDAQPESVRNLVIQEFLKQGWIRNGVYWSHPSRPGESCEEPYDMSDATNHPSHYNATKFEVWDVLDEWFPDSPLLWNVGKYIARANHKGKTLEDLNKARAYLDREIARLEKVSSVETP